MLVTDIKKIDDKRSCLYLDYEAFGPLYASDIRRLKLTVGSETDAEKMQQFRSEYFFKRAMNKAVTAIKYSEKCEYDIRQKLKELCYDEEVIDAEKNDTRVVLHFHPAIAPFKAAVLPLSKKLSDQAGEVFDTLSKKFNVDFDDAGSIGKRYRRQDEIGTPYCITYDFDSVEDGCVTVRDRDTMEQVRLPISELTAFIESKLEF